jgi:hypothetical protein
MPEVRYGLVEGDGKGREVRLAPNQYFHRKGGHFVQLRNNVKGALASLCASGIGRVFGWVESPKQAEGYDAWLGSATAATDKLFCIYADPDNVFEIPAKEIKASVNASCIGKGAGLCLVGSTYTLIQKAQVGGAVTASPVFVVDFDKDKRTLFVKVKQTKRQAN